MEQSRGILMYQFQQKLKNLRAKIRTWNKEEVQDIFQDKKLLKVKLKYIQREGMDNGYSDDIKKR